MLDPAVHAAARRRPSAFGAADGRGRHEAVRMRRPHDVSRAACGGRDSGGRSAGRGDPCALSRGARAGRRPRRGYEPFRRSASRQARRAALAREVPADHCDRSAGAHRGRPAGRAQPRDQRSGRALRSLLRAGSVFADRVHDRRQRRGERRRRPLSQVRAHRAQRAPRARRADHRRDRRIRRRRARQRGLRPARARQRLARDCSP